jgi:hypothetical protein
VRVTWSASASREGALAQHSLSILCHHPIRAGVWHRVGIILRPVDAGSSANPAWRHFRTERAGFANMSDLLTRYAASALLQNHPNPLLRYGGKVYSQNDEDGITFEILRRTGIAKGVFGEFGVGNGVENNTLALAAAGWCGFWVGGSDLAFDSNPAKAARLNFHFQKAWITKANLLALYRNGLDVIRQPRCDLISVDLDGNDYYFVEALLASRVAPAIFIVEYNARFMPPIKFKIDYDDHHQWAGDDYFGASLACFAELFRQHDYFLACCNITGSNAFFIRNEYKPLFRDVPAEIERLYASPKYFLTGLDVSGHPMSPRTVDKIFRELNSDRDATAA